MKTSLHVIAFIAIIWGSVYLWNEYRPHKPSPELAPVPNTGGVRPAKKPPADDGPDSTVRVWTDRNGRSFEGTLISAKDDRVVVRRQSDFKYFFLPVTSLAPTDQEYVSEQIQKALTSGRDFVEEIPGYFSLSRKLEVKGYILRVPAPALVGGWKHNRVDPSYWFLLSKKLHGDNEGTHWIRIDERTYRTHPEGALLAQEQLSAFMDPSGNLRDALPWPRSRVTLIEAKYGPPEKVVNVTEKIMCMASNGALPTKVSYEIFGLKTHAPEIWDLTVAWRTPEGEIRQTIRDGSILNWP